MTFSQGSGLRMVLLLGVLSGCAWLGASLLAGTMPATSGDWAMWCVAGLAIAVLRIQALRAFHVTSGWERFVTFRDFVQLLWSAASACSVTVLVSAAATSSVLTIRTVVLDAGLGLAFVAMIRAWPRLRHDWVRRRAGWNSRRVLIWGTGVAEETLLRVLERQPPGAANVVGLIGPQPESCGRRLGGVPIVAHEGDWEEKARRLGIDELFVVSGSQNGETIRRVINEAARATIPVRVLPSYSKLLSGEVRVVPRDISIEDVLRREPVELHSDVLARWLQGRTVLITGGAGSIGSELVRQLLAFSPHKLVIVDRSELGIFQASAEHAERPNVVCCLADVNDANGMEEIFADHRPHVVFHAAAFKHVPILESHPREAVRNIVGATAQLTDIAAKFRVETFVLISTDKAVAPASVMGACKRVAERYVQAIADDSPCRFVTVRFGNVLDSAGSVVPTFREQIARGGPVTVTHPEMCRFFMTIPEASQLVIHAGAMGRGGEIFVLRMGEPVRIVELARDLIRLSGMTPEVDIPIAFTGLRPGEKLREQLADVGESLRPTSHPGIDVVSASPLPCEQYKRAVERLLQVASTTRHGLLERLCELVPEYKTPRVRPEVGSDDVDELRSGPASALMSGTSASRRIRDAVRPSDDLDAAHDTVGSRDILRADGPGYHAFR